jgi:hypothetical protein
MLSFDANDVNQRHPVVIVEIEIDVRTMDKI